MIRRPPRSTLFPNPVLFFFLMIGRPPRSPLFPYPTFFRSAFPSLESAHLSTSFRSFPLNLPADSMTSVSLSHLAVLFRSDGPLTFETSLPSDLKSTAKRSEEHTSELQSHLNLVCRLLLEKK